MEMSQSRFGLFEYIDGPAHLQLNHLTDLSDSDLKMLRRSHATLRGLQTPGTFAVLEANFEEMLGLFESLEKCHLGTRPGDREFHPDSEKIISRTLTVISNYLGSTRTYLDNMSAALSASHGRDSPLWRAFKSDTNVQYDEFFEYRFSSRLRNVLIHSGRIPLSIRETLDSGRRRVRVLSVRDELLATGDWNAKLREDLKSQGFEIDILDVLRKGFDSFPYIENRRLLRELEHSSPQIRDLAAWLRAAGVPDMVRTAVWPLTAGGSVPLMFFNSPSDLQSLVDNPPLSPDRGQEPARSSANQIEADGPTREANLKAIDALQAAHFESTEAATARLKQVVLSGPEPAYELICGLMNITRTSMFEVGMVLGQSYESQLDSHRELYGS